MLVLTRKSEEKIVIGKKKQIVITILKIQGDKVSVGIEAPEDEPIMRKELLLRDAEKSRDKSQDREALQRLQMEAQNTRTPSMSSAERYPEQIHEFSDS